MKMGSMGTQCPPYPYVDILEVFLTIYDKFQVKKTHNFSTESVTSGISLKIVPTTYDTK